MRLAPILLAVGVAVSGCSGGSTTASVPSASTGTVPSVAIGSGSKPVIAPTYLYFEYNGQQQSFEVYGRKENNQSRWTSGSSCKRLIKITFAGFNDQGSAYTATAQRPGVGCKYKVSNHHGKTGVLEMYVSSD